MEINLTIILTSVIAFSLFLVFGLMLFVRMVKMDQRQRQKKMVEQAKANVTLNEIIRVKDDTISKYKQIVNHL
jgi:hypothetical protein